MLIDWWYKNYNGEGSGKGAQDCIGTRIVGERGVHLLASSPGSRGSPRGTRGSPRGTLGSPGRHEAFSGDAP